MTAAGEPTLQTVTGPVGPQEAGRILPHEHFFLDMTHEAVAPRTAAERDLFYGGVRMENLGLLRRNPYVVRDNLILDDEETAAREIACLRQCGCGLALDLTSIGLGRDLERLRRLSQRAGLRIAAGCGLFVEPSLPPKWREQSVDALAALLVKELESGVGESGIRPGVIGEIGASEVIHPVEGKSLRAAALACAHTGRPVFVHTYPWSRSGLEAAHILIAGGAPAEKICLCHVDVKLDFAYLQELLQLGVYLEFDNLGKEFSFDAQDGAFAGGPFATDRERARMLRKLAALGHAGRILLSNDLCLKASLHRYGGWGYDHLYKNFAPMLLAEGVPAAAVAQMLERNPRQFLFGQAEKR